jgi:hypothetical protein
MANEQGRTMLSIQGDRAYVIVCGERSADLRAFLQANGVRTGDVESAPVRFDQFELKGDWQEGEAEHLGYWRRYRDVTFERPFAAGPGCSVILVARVEGERVRCVVTWEDLVSNGWAPDQPFDAAAALLAAGDHRADLEKTFRVRLARFAPEGRDALLR